jgi:hypothetical protein
VIHAGFLQDSHRFLLGDLRGKSGAEGIMELFAPLGKSGSHNVEETRPLFGP